MDHFTIKHGSEAGYREEIKTGDACERCRNGHREFGKQYSKAYKSRGTKYGKFDVVDHLYVPRGAGPGRARTGPPSGRSRTGPAYSAPTVTSGPPGSTGAHTAGPVTAGPDPDPEPVQRGVGARLADGMRDLFVADTPDLLDVDAPDYLHPVDPDPEPDGEWAEVRDEEFVINAAGMKRIEDSLGTYLSIVGMTVEMVDPYCGPIIADNIENMVARWSKVIAHYPKAAALFLDTKGGTIMAWISALQATWPVLYAMYEHHLSKSVKVEEGKLYRKSGMNGQTQFPDATMPPMHDSFRYTAE